MLGGSLSGARTNGSSPKGVELVELLSGHARPMNMGEAVLDDFAAAVKRGFEGIAADMNEIG